ncbi:hypothetical protein QA640_21980 [Bradyrhizobium sp. CB82]|uniref:hypothetical protein n=1 Tax=Bradyrhizobium sp. CB82 TaxID=3039159 RepID=UPI0024B1A65B|nr:hypothetical protein [Bradyrhizobium sp. CB82]WFU44892.1 hypothetical protein QA640_21980 [Bradyrhizobium sp. CB82]
MADKFLIVFFTTVTLTLVCGGVAAFIVAFGHDPGPPMMTELYNTALKLFTAGVGAIIGLVGGSKLT